MREAQRPGVVDGARPLPLQHYSVPTRYGFEDIPVKGFVDEVVILCGGKIVARHPRSYAEGAFAADPLDYLALIEIKPNALDQAAAL